MPDETQKPSECDPQPPQKQHYDPPLLTDLGSFIELTYTNLSMNLG